MPVRSTTPHFSGGTGLNNRDVSKGDFPAEFRTRHRLNARQKQSRLRQFAQYKKERERERNALRLVI